MPQKARIRLISQNLEDVDNVAAQIKEISEKMGARVRGPVPLPTKKLRVVTRKSPCGQGTHTFDKWELRIHRRLIDIEAADQRVLAQLARLNIPESVTIQLKLTA
ncbi:MAG: 30S ribosomal protein S10 [Nitrososphaeria archaeon]|jgi:small subunit ribosomal protein S10